MFRTDDIVDWYHLTGVKFGNFSKNYRSQNNKFLEPFSLRIYEFSIFMVYLELIQSINFFLLLRNWYTIEIDTQNPKATKKSWNLEEDLQLHNNWITPSPFPAVEFYI